jgi:hypothetical protein
LELALTFCFRLSTFLSLQVLGLFGWPRKAALCLRRRYAFFPRPDQRCGSSISSHKRAHIPMCCPSCRKGKTFFVILLSLPFSLHPSPPPPTPPPFPPPRPPRPRPPFSVPGFEDSLFSFDPSGLTWRTLDPGSSDASTIQIGTTADDVGGVGPRGAGGVWRPRARARLGMVWAPSGLYVFGGQGTNIFLEEDYIPVGPRDNGPAKYGALEGIHFAYTLHTLFFSHWQELTCNTVAWTYGNHERCCL